MVVRVSSNGYSPLYRDALSGGRRCSYPLTYLSTRGDGSDRGLTVSVLGLVREPSNDRLLCLAKGRKGPTDRPTDRPSTHPSVCPFVCTLNRSDRSSPSTARHFVVDPWFSSRRILRRVPYVRPLSPFCRCFLSGFKGRRHNWFPASLPVRKKKEIILLKT